MSFEITFLGASGGPLEGSTCSILLKSADISYQSIIDKNLTHELLCIDAGAGMGKLAEIIHQESLFQTSYCNFLNYYPDCEPVGYYYHPLVAITTPFKNFTPHRSIIYTQKIFNHLENYLITHAHLDHVSALVINSAGFNNKLLSKVIHGSHCTINALQKNLFNGKIWPNMPSFNLVNLRYLDSSHKLPTRIGNYDVKMFDLSHGEFNKLVEEEHYHQPQPQQNNNSTHLSVPTFGKTDQPRRRSSITTIPQNSNGIVMKNSEALNHHYLSSAFLIKHHQKTTSILIFGDFESDLTSKLSRNSIIWQHVSPLVVNNQLAAIVLECSNSVEIDSDQLYGHLTPRLLVHELKQLEIECRKLKPGVEKPLASLNVIVNHVKEPILDISDDKEEDVEVLDPRKKILVELNKLNDLGCRFSIALSGTSIIV
ncbi:3',5'-cyclic-nucleotide phosphodiesterase [Candida viswanathii]|uniref:3',5'-cyclic-nucleotide phosphodiesterase n=1 Tax=Candida viswanathii TaxID=5486 RepID=A0A367YJI3_9ASCO|nr:3',5'-cyclic-nucleotide phosphodiesterase [Candida viswanathii]